MLNGEVLPLHRVPLAVKVPLATTARCSGTASAATPLTENGAPQGDLQTTFPNRRLENSATRTRTRVARVRAEYPNQLDYSGFCHTLEKQTWASRRRLRRPERPSQARPGLEPAIPDSVGRCLIHWATGPSGGDDAQAILSASVALGGGATGARARNLRVRWPSEQQRGSTHSVGTP